MAHFRLCGAGDWLWLPFEADVMGGKKSPNVPCKNIRIEGILGVFCAPITNGFDHKLVLPPSTSS